MQAPLLWACRVFRSVVYSRFFSCYRLRFDIFEGKAVGRPLLLPPCLNKLDSPFHLLAKEVLILISPSTVYSGKALTALSQEPFTGCSLPLVRTLEVRFVSDEESTDVIADTEANIQAFVQRIRQLLPKLTLLRLVGGHSSRERIRETGSNFDSLVTQLIQAVSQVELASSVGQFFRFPQVDTIRDLTHLNCRFELNGDQAIQLIRLNAPTLQSLSIAARSGYDPSGIIQGADGGFIEYPRLHSLTFGLMTGGAVPRQYRFHGAVPFPNLRRLICGIHYPFGDDLALFQGNATTLEVLQLTLTRELAAALLRQRVFTPTSHPKLQCAMVRPIPGMIPINYADDPETIQLMLDIAPNAAVRRICNWNFNQLVPPVLSLFGKHVCLQVLDLPDLRLSIWDAMMLVRSLPLLSDFHSKAPTLSPLPAGVSRRKLAVHASSNYSPHGSRFRFWHIRDDDVGHLRDSVKPFLLLALAFSGFDRVIVPSHKRDVFLTSVEKAIDMAEFKQHAPSLRRLLRGGQDI
ncbi:hypothetical protein GGI06_000433 [Coemansia sp. S85]|nr:hypothetical protein GGI06_000433 [Coemansia sp. S85]